MAQCGQCRYYIPLYGKFKSDYGACSNSKSPFDQKVMFEHDGCEYFEPVEDTPNRLHRGELSIYLGLSRESDRGGRRTGGRLVGLAALSRRPIGAVSRPAHQEWASGGFVRGSQSLRRGGCRGGPSAGRLDPGCQSPWGNAELRQLRDRWRRHTEWKPRECAKRRWPSRGRYR